MTIATLGLAQRYGARIARSDAHPGLPWRVFTVGVADSSVWCPTLDSAIALTAVRIRVKHVNNRTAQELWDWWNQFRLRPETATSW